jgi:hypothetical protein
LLENINGVDGRAMSRVESDEVADEFRRSSDEKEYVEEG